jgi:hypothetical protein
MAVALVMLGKRTSVLEKVCHDTQFVMYAGCQMDINRVVFISTVEHQLEWLKCVISSPDDCSFSLLPGVPVKNIVLLPSVSSGVDFICIATAKTAVAAAAAAVVVSPEAGPRRYKLPRVAKRKLDGDDGTSGVSSSSSAELLPPEYMFVQICDVTDAKVEKDVSNYLEQFLNSKVGTAGAECKRLVKENANKFNYLSIHSIPRIPNTISKQYIKITDVDAGGKELFSQ